ncbi:MAG: hypothetical protein J6Y55_04210 [Bacteroidales bacterium]|nr:hypothetical protein [Bacteroidales bacterium]
MIDKSANLWYPLRISYSSDSRVMKLKDLLDNEDDVETYVPMTYKRVDSRLQLVPALNNILFVYTTFAKLEDIKKNKTLYEPLRYMMHSVSEDNGQRHSEVIYVPEQSMNDFIRVTSTQNEHVEYLRNMDFVYRPGTKVQVVDGVFKGVKGIVKRIKKNMCVVVPVGGIAAVAITSIPRCFLEVLVEDEHTNL